LNGASRGGDRNWGGGELAGAPPRDSDEGYERERNRSGRARVKRNKARLQVKKTLESPSKGVNKKNAGRLKKEGKTGGTASVGMEQSKVQSEDAWYNLAIGRAFQGKEKLLVNSREGRGKYSVGRSEGGRYERQNDNPPEKTQSPRSPT